MAEACPRGNVIDHIGPYASYGDTVRESHHLFKSKPEPPASDASPYTKVCEFANLALGESFERDCGGSQVRWKRIISVPLLSDKYRDYLIEHAAFNLDDGRMEYFGQRDRIFRIPVMLKFMMKMRRIGLLEYHGRIRL